MNFDSVPQNCHKNYAQNNIYSIKGRFSFEKQKDISLLTNLNSIKVYYQAYQFFKQIFLFIIYLLDKFCKIIFVCIFTQRKYLSIQFLHTIYLPFFNKLHKMYKNKR